MAQFSFSRLKGADPLLGVEMASTGEVACLGDQVEEAYLKALLSVGFSIPEKGILLTTGKIEDKVDFLESARKLQQLDIPVYATKGTHDFLKENDIETRVLKMPMRDEEFEEGSDAMDAIEAIEKGLIDLVINIPRSLERNDLTSGYLVRRKTVDYGINFYI